MAEVIANAAATTVVGSAIDKLTSLLGRNYQLAGDVQRDIRFLKQELKCTYAVLQKLEGKDDDQIDPMAKDWRSKVRELSYDIEDCIDRFVLNNSHGGSNAIANFLRNALRALNMVWKGPGIAQEIQELKRLVIEQREQGNRYYVDIRQSPADSHQQVPFDDRVHELFQEERDLVGIDGPRDEVIRLLKAEENEHKVVSIYGTAGQGKTTLAMEVLRKITQAFHCRAFVSVSQTPDVKKLLRDMLFQISKSEFNQSESWETNQLLRTIRKHLMNKR
ncbi:hypothetical protein HU200_011031 [Digitaria exilis]|uniref:Uncharacterized protein n=1 Tax=Digitaria exilis TaxID=1010633 RepID=A0A835FGH6_9POAL|nr:hypothetical protein HU200_011031 [Digitaria exilis]